MKKQMKTLVTGLALHTHADSSLDNDCEKKSNLKKWNSQRGSLTITALFTVLIFSLYGILLYARSASAYIRQSKSIEKIQATYAQDVPNAVRITEQLGGNNNITVAFDANGGIVDTSYKKVAYGEDYGELPVPRREGYTFKGWNGKNKFNESKYLNLSDYPTYVSAYDWAEIELEANKTYKVDITYHNEFDGKIGTIILAMERSPASSAKWTSIAHSSMPNHSLSNFQYTTDESGILYIGRGHSATQLTLDTIWANTDVQIEEGTEATAYEPYYITPGTKVVQQKDHVLTAIWEAN